MTLSFKQTFFSLVAIFGIGSFSSYFLIGHDLLILILLSLLVVLNSTAAITVGLTIMLSERLKELSSRYLMVLPKI
jgi:hypothetical protein